MWASWCLPCRRFAPIFAQTAQSTPDVTFASFQVDASEENEAMFAALGYTTVPTLMAFRNGTLVVATSGALGKADLATVLKQVREDAPAAA
ncbi:MAG: thioredoxin family protein [Propionibacteriaceae bacterium]|nr:thioredoxin family protein [Propionibacteriaceae bacterium]